MNREWEPRREKAKKAYVACLVNENFPRYFIDDRLVIFPDARLNPVLDFAPESEVIKRDPTNLGDAFGEFSFGLVKVWVLTGWKDNYNTYVVDLHGISYPPQVDRKQLVFDPEKSLKEGILRNLALWGEKHKEKIEKCEKAYLSIIFWRKFDYREGDFMAKILSLSKSQAE